MTRRLCVIPARGGSKRLPRKNAAEFLGRPIIAYTVDAALRADRFARVVVSTDDGEIAAAAGAAGAEVDPRPAHLAGDDAGIADVCLELLDREEAAGRTYDVLAILLATAALRTAADVRATVDLVGPGGVEFAMAVTTFGFPPHQALRDDGAGGLRALWPDLINARSSEFGQVCVDNGSTYAAAVPAYRARRGDLYAPGLRGHVMPRARSVDIDYAEDLDFARLLAQGGGAMKVLVAGCGSIGRRHAALLAARAEVAVVDLDGALAARTGAELGLRHFDDLDAALAWGPGGAVVATPNTSHLPVARACLDAGAGVLIEKPISADLAEAEVFLDYLAGTGGSAHVVCNMRFHPGVAGLAAHLHRVGAPRFARAQFGHYLPQMRPQARYQDLYCARRARGGGVILDAIHEIDYLMWLFGPVAAVTCEAARLSDLDIDVEDYAVAVLRHASGVRSEVHLDYLQRRKRRGCEIAGQDGTLVWLSDGKAPEHCALDLYTTGTETWQPLLASPAVDDDACYGALLDNFLAALDGRPHDLLSAEMATDELRVALAARRAAETGATVVPLEMAA